MYSLHPVPRFSAHAPQPGDPEQCLVIALSTPSLETAIARFAQLVTIREFTIQRLRENPADDQARELVRTLDAELQGVESTILRLGGRQCLAQAHVGFTTTSRLLLTASKSTA